MIKKDSLRWQFLTSTISTTMALLLLGALTLFVLTAKEIRNYVHQDMTVTTILADTTSETTAQNLVVTLGEKVYVHKIDFISREQALQEQVEAVDKLWRSLTERQRDYLLAMRYRYSSIVEKWKVPNILS